MSVMPQAKKQKVVSLEGALLGMGNPLLDMSADVPEEFFNKYDVKPANAILAEEKHLLIYKDLVDNYKVSYLAGGSTQNSIRVAQWLLQKPKSTAFIGSVGKDDYGKELEKCARKDGVAVHYYKDPEEPTGTCACLILDKERSLVTNLKAANNYKIEHLQSKEIQAVVDKARFYYIAGFFLTVSPPSVMHVAEHAHEKKKTFVMNLSAPFICQFYKDAQLAALPYCDIIFGNESEAKAFGENNELKDTSPLAVCKHLSSMPKKNSERKRIAVITQGPDPVIICVGDEVTEYPVPKVDNIVDSNGAGDAFVGGFLAAFMQEKELAECVQAGCYCSGTILKVSGTVLKGKPAAPSKWPKADASKAEA
eukprot:gb/GEZN01004651.1/.p1 GENE.gb/GEZN01004651.1/~~gb/GEZN01004651.1/.p1  ORF type:complete len:365 (-),score=66.25 gb/GEZN01004651.1/:662-1756(-)